MASRCFSPLVRVCCTPSGANDGRCRGFFIAVPTIRNALAPARHVEVRPCLIPTVTQRRDTLHHESIFHHRHPGERPPLSKENHATFARAKIMPETSPFPACRGRLGGGEPLREGFRQVLTPPQPSPASRGGSRSRGSHRPRSVAGIRTSHCHASIRWFVRKPPRTAAGERRGDGSESGMPFHGNQY